MFRLSTIAFLMLGLGSLCASPDSIPYHHEKMLRYEASMVLGKDAETRKIGFDSLSLGLTQMLSDPSSFSDTLTYLRSLSVLYGKDSTFRVISVQCEESPEKYIHLGYLQTQDTTYYLRDASDTILHPITEKCSAEHWYGALYYHIEPFSRDGEEFYLLLGYDGHSISNRRKLIEVMSFDSSGSPAFGEQVFNHTIFSHMRRFILEYSSEVGIRLNYDTDLEMIVFDHLIPMKSIYQNESMVMVSDGSYEGFKLEDGGWTHVEKVFHEVNVGAPGEGLSKERMKLFKN